MVVAFWRKLLLIRRKRRFHEDPCSGNIGVYLSGSCLALGEGSTEAVIMIDTWFGPEGQGGARRGMAGQGR